MKMEEQRPINTNIPQTSTLAIISLIAGVLGFTMLPLVGSIAALLTGYAARKETRAVPPLGGRWSGHSRHYHGLGADRAGRDRRLLFRGVFYFCGRCNRVVV